MEHWLRVPATDGALLESPAKAEWPALVEANRRSMAASRATLAGLSLGEFRRVARAEAAAAHRVHFERFETPPVAPLPEDAPWIVTGHQPDLFHPGVWIKNFAVGGLALALGGVGLHVLADADTIKRTAWGVPAGRPEEPFLGYIAVDAPGPEIPFEERAVLDEEVFGAFAERAGELMMHFPMRPILDDFWRQAIAARRFTGILGERLAHARRVFERRWGTANAEAPLSALCRGESFRRLAAALLLDADRFRSIHNQALLDYRRRNRIRSRHHPVPALERDGERVETAFWAWNKRDPVRRRVFCRAGRNVIELDAGATRIAAIPLSDRDGAGSLAARLAEALGEWKLRPRALVTTMFLRLALADLFLHGVGGGKYDELTDALLREFFDVQPPRYAVLSATLYPPLGGEPEPEKRRRLERLQRDLHWNPDRHLDPVLRDQEPLAGWIERKHELASAAPAGRKDRIDRFLELRRLNDRLRAYLGELPERTRRQLEKERERQTSLRLARSRELAMCLYPESSLRGLFAKVSAANFPSC